MTYAIHCELPDADWRLTDLEADDMGEVLDLWQEQALAGNAPEMADCLTVLIFNEADPLEFVACRK